MPADFSLHVEKNISVTELFKYIDLKILYRMHLGLRKEHCGSEKEKKISLKVNQVKINYGDILSGRAVYGFFECGKIKKEMEIPFQHDVNDNMAMFVVTCGTNIRDEVEKLKNDGNYLESHILASLAIQLAESAAVMIHEKINSLWGNTKTKRYSFGYPSCPDLSNQRKLFNYLKPEENIGVMLTDGFMMEPEASVSAIVFNNQ